MRCEFVDSIASSPTVRLNLDSSPWNTLEDTDFGFPDLRRVVATSMMVDGGRVIAAAYDNRSLDLKLSVETASADATAAEIQKLIRELDRHDPISGPDNLLRVDRGTEQVFFRTFRSPEESQRLIGALDTCTDKMTINVSVLAEPFALGLIQTPAGLDGATLSTDPAAGSNGNFVEATGVIGEIETPALIRWPAGAVVANRETLFAVRRGGTPSGAPFLFQAEALTNGTDTSDQANGSFSGGNGTRTTFGTASMQTRLTLSDLGTAGINLRGRYKVYVRYAKTVSGDDINFRIQWGTSGGVVTTNETFDAPAGTGIMMGYLGEIQVPRGNDPVHNFFDLTHHAVADTFHMAFQAERIGGSGNLDADYFVFVPADDRLGIAKWVEAGPDRWWMNGYDNNIHARNSSDQIATAMPPGFTGGLPMLSPGETNRIYMLYEVGRGMTTTLTTVTVTVSYYPRYLHVKPASI